MIPPIHNSHPSLPVSSSFHNPCDLVRRTCRTWMEDVATVEMEMDIDADDRSNGSIVDNNSDDDDDEERRYWSQQHTSSSSSKNDYHHRSVLLRFDKLPALVDEMLRQQQQQQQTAVAATNNLVHTKEELETSTSTGIAWDTEGWHYTGVGFTGPAHERNERVALYLFVLDAINFCFWPVPGTTGVNDDDDNDDDANDNDAEHSCYNNSHDDKKSHTPSHPITNQLEYEHLAMALKKMAEADHRIISKKNKSTRNDTDNAAAAAGYDDGYVFSPKNLATMTTEKFLNLLLNKHNNNPNTMTTHDNNHYHPPPPAYLDPQKYPVPNIQKRVELLREVGHGLLRDYEGSVLKLLHRANRDASKLVELVAVSFPGFRDEVTLGPRNKKLGASSSSSALLLDRIVFLKRAQIFVGDINAALHLQLNGIERLTTFADYRVPQVLRHWKILVYAPSLANKVDNYIELQKGSYDEISIRSATVVAVEELVQLLNNNNNNNNIINHHHRDLNEETGIESKMEYEGKKGNIGNRKYCKYNDVTVDWYLWQVGERMHQNGILKPFHRVRTHFY